MTVFREGLVEVGGLRGGKQKRCFVFSGHGGGWGGRGGRGGGATGKGGGPGPTHKPGGGALNWRGDGQETHKGGGKPQGKNLQLGKAGGARGENNFPNKRRMHGTTR